MRQQSEATPAFALKFNINPENVCDYPKWTVLEKMPYNILPDGGPVHIRTINNFKWQFILTNEAASTSKPLKHRLDPTRLVGSASPSWMPQQAKQENWRQIVDNEKRRSRKVHSEAACFALFGDFPLSLMGDGKNRLRKETTEKVDPLNKQASQTCSQSHG